MKKIFLLVFGIVVISACQRDDFCIDPITPNLVIRFYDSDNQDIYKNVIDLTVWADGREELYTGVTTDSIAIPLDPNNDMTLYHLSSEDLEDDITFLYTRKEVFVSRSCGFKYDFESLTFEDATNNWIEQIEITNENVTDETEHVKILH
ncbi:hypothetical protein KH5_23910 [Urechidicola sp. KH5]